MNDIVGWIATGVFAASYFSRNPNTLRWIQAAAALLWIGYGLSVGAAPVVVANLVVAGMAVVSASGLRWPGGSQPAAGKRAD